MSENTRNTAGHALISHARMRAAVALQKCRDIRLIFAYIRRADKAAAAAARTSPRAHGHTRADEKARSLSATLLKNAR